MGARKQSPKMNVEAPRAKYAEVSTKEMKLILSRHVPGVGWLMCLSARCDILEGSEVRMKPEGVELWIECLFSL